MTENERREASRQFYYTWKDRGKEKSDSQPFWNNLLRDVLGMDHIEERVQFEKPVIVDGQTKSIDVYIPESKVLIEQKSSYIDLDTPIKQSGGEKLTPYQQAKRYSDNLRLDEKPRWIVISNFTETRIYNMNTMEPEKDIIKILLKDIQSEFHRLKFLIKEEDKIASKEVEISIQAGDIVGLIYDALLEQYTDNSNVESLKSLNKLCVRLVFCLYAEDSGLFDNHLMFHDYMEQFEAKNWRNALIDLFKVLDTKIEERDPYLNDDLAAFPYVNGGLFVDENIEIPRITDNIRTLILDKGCNFNWSKITPTIFGAVFESTLNPTTRRTGGMHYTSIENIHKVIDPLFINDLKEELEDIKKISLLRTKKDELKKFQSKLASLKFLDPACGSGNFLTETYTSLRKLENEVILILTEGQVSWGQVINLIQVSIKQFYGIEINDFAATVAKTALWIAEHQMMKETEDIIHMSISFLPLKTNATIIEGNALQLNWNKIIHKNSLSYIMGNPPFIGARLMTYEQKEDMSMIFGKQKGIGNLDYISCWYKKIADYLKGTTVEVALVSTNSITQGEQAGLLWKPIFEEGMHINFAYRTFRWDSEASIKAHVHCVIIGFSYKERNNKILYNEHGDGSVVSFINAYLVDAPNVFIMSRKKSIQDIPPMEFGSMPNDGGFLSNYDDISKDEIVSKYPQAEKYFKRFIGATEFLHNKSRWCLWLKDANLSEIRSIQPIVNAVKSVQEMRSSSNRSATRKLANTPSLFGEIRQPEETYLIVPAHSSGTRKYIPIGYISPDIICGNANMLIPNATLYSFGILTSNVHMAWMSAVCGRIKSDYRYSATVVYNNFPWPSPTEEQKAKIEKTAQGILDVRANHPNDSLADLYDPLIMPSELRKAHQLNDKAVMQAYGLSVKHTNEASCVAFLMGMYQDLIK